MLIRIDQLFINPEFIAQIGPINRRRNDFGSSEVLLGFDVTFSSGKVTKVEMRAQTKDRLMIGANYAHLSYWHWHLRNPEDVFTRSYAKYEEDYRIDKDRKRQLGKEIADAFSNTDFTPIDLIGQP